MHSLAVDFGKKRGRPDSVNAVFSREGCFAWVPDVLRSILAPGAAIRPDPDSSLKGIARAITMAPLLRLEDLHWVRRYYPRFREGLGFRLHCGRNDSEFMG